MRHNDDAGPRVGNDDQTADDLFAWLNAGLIAVIPLAIAGAAMAVFDLPIWAFLLVALLAGFATRPLQRHFTRKGDARRRSSEGE